MNYQQTLDFLYNSLPVFQHVGGSAYKAGLDNIVALEEALGNPHRKIRSVHVAGTNGKGSVSHMIASTLTAAGYRTGLFTSPHLKDFRERIRIDGRMISEGEVIGFVERNRETIDRVQPSFFEITTALAFDCFARPEVDVAVVEVGMGGRLDSTNIVRPLVSVITNIGYDHTQFLGDTLEQIAGEKAGIIKEDTPVVVGESRIETQLVFIDKAKTSRAPILFADQVYRVAEQVSRPQGQSFEIENRLDGSRFRIDSDLPGLYQRKNVLTALAALDVLNGAGGLSVSREQVFRGIAAAARTTGLMGRWQQLGERPLVVCDTGHNEAGITEVAAQLAATERCLLFLHPGGDPARTRRERAGAAGGRVRIARGLRRKRIGSAPQGAVAGRPGRSDFRRRKHLCCGGDYLIFTADKNDKARTYLSAGFIVLRKKST